MPAKDFPPGSTREPVLKPVSILEAPPHPDDGGDARK